jgi:ABC-type maltose transport system permease subunit
MVNLEGLSEKAKIGKILILVSLILGIIAICAVYAIIALLPLFKDVPFLVLVILGGLASIKVIGLIFGFFAYQAAERNDFNKAGMYAIISCALPPLDVIMVAGAIFCLISSEAENKKEAR